MSQKVRGSAAAWHGIGRDRDNIIAVKRRGDRFQGIGDTPKAEYAWYHQYYFATEHGALGCETYRHDSTKLIWQIASPKWDFNDAIFDRSAIAFEDPDEAACRNKFPGEYAHRIVSGGVGHNLPQQAPEAIAEAVIEVGGS